MQSPQKQGVWEPGFKQQKERKAQAEKVNERKILTKYNLDTDYVVVAGYLNDTPKSKPLQSLLTNNMLFNLVDEVSGSKGTYLNTEDQIDYLLVSKALFERLSRGCHREKRNIQEWASRSVQDSDRTRGPGIRSRCGMGVF